ncbi:MAG: SCO family protein [Bdellovibrionales bacterium]|nr:SCO family protein [Bdellovibrionales bacterium]
MTDYLLESEVEQDGSYAFTALALLIGWLLATMILWWFALYQTAESTPEWLLRARAVCFGTNESGLPDTYGWTVLTLAPLSMLLSLIVALGAEVRASLSFLTKRLAGKLAILGVSLLVSLQVAWATQRIQDGLAVTYTSFAPEGDEALPTTYPRTSRDAPDFELIDQTGQHVSLAKLSEKPLILTFAFAHCRTVCPALVASARSAIAPLPLDGVGLAVVTLDPWRDTPGALPHLAKKWNMPKNAHVLSGEATQVMKVLEDYGVPTSRDTRTGDISHPPLVYVIGPNSKIQYTMNNPSPRWLRDAVLRTLVEDEITGAND